LLRRWTSDIKDEGSLCRKGMRVRKYTLGDKNNALSLPSTYDV